MKAIHVSLDDQFIYGNLMKRDLKEIIREDILAELPVSDEGVQEF